MARNTKPSGSYNDSAREINKDAARDFALKIKLEGDLNSKLSQYFYKVDKQVTKAYEETGSILPSSLFQEELKNILANHYRTVAKHFSSKLRMKANSYNKYEYKALFCENKALDHDISSQLLGYISKHSNEQAGIISETNLKEYGSIIDKVKKDAAINAIILTNKQIARDASILFKGRYTPRIQTIAITETQNIAEKSKLIEAEALNSVVTSNQKANRYNPRQVTKQWVTVLDERTRIAHVAADSQVQFLRVPFVVGGEKMMAPGDMTLGASIGNTINCRCSSNYLMPDDPNAPFVDELDEVNSNAGELVAEWEDDNGNNWGFNRGYASVYDIPTVDEGFIYNRTQYDTALAILKVTKTDYVPMYYNHDKSRLIGWFPVKDMINTNAGLYVEGYINLSSEAGREVAQRVKFGLSRYYSVGVTLNRADGTFVLREVSIVDNPANPGAAMLPVDVTRRGRLAPKEPPKPNDSTYISTDLQADFGDLLDE